MAKAKKITKNQIFRALGLKSKMKGANCGGEWFASSKDYLESYSPTTGELLGKIEQTSPKDYDLIMKQARSAFLEFRSMPAPQRGEIVRQVGEALREKKEMLGALVSLEMGKIYSEGLGEVQEMIDICDFAVGQSRLINGVSLQSERKEHRLFEQYQPLGVVGIVTSFNFPVAVWAWNTALAAIAGDVVIWKPSSKTPLSAIATQKIIHQVLVDNNVPEGVFNLVVAKSSVMGDNFLSDKRIPLLSVTGSTAVGKRVGGIVGKRLGKTILELGGNNAVIITPNADIPMAIASTVFGTVGTAGQRCTSTRRIIIHDSIYSSVKDKIVNAYKSVATKIGDPLDENSLVGPLIDEHSVNAFTNAVEKVVEEGGKILFGGEVIEGKGFESGNFVMPCIAEAENHFEIVQEETFGPIVYLIKYTGDINDAIAIQNDVPQGLSSCVFTLNMREAEIFVSAAGSDCGIANVNVGTSGAEIGGAFGGEKETGGGRESGSDSWKVYMRRQTSTFNYGAELPLAQGIKFDF